MKPRKFVVASLAIGVAMAYGVASSAPKCTLAQVEEWPVRKVHNHLVVDGAINGRKVGIMLDTGSSLSLILRAAAARLDLPKQDANGIRLFGVGGETRVEVAIVDEFAIGKTTLKDMRLLVAGENDFAAGFEVILGEDFLHKFDVEFDLHHGAVRLFQSKDCDGKSLAYWTREVAGEVEIDAFSDARPQILLDVQVNGHPIRALLDSGASASVLTKRDAAVVGITPETPGVVAAGAGRGLGANSVDSWIGPIQSFTIGNETIHDTAIVFEDLYKDMKFTSTGSNVRRSASQQQPMLLGADFLRAHRVLVAHSQRKLYFTFAGGPVFITGAPAATPAESATSPTTVGK